MKFKKLKWEKNLHSDQYESLIYSEATCDESWIEAVVFEKDGAWHLHYQDQDPSEHILTATSFEEVLEAAQAFHEANIIFDFIEPEPPKPIAIGRMVTRPGHEPREAFEVLSCEEFNSYVAGRTFRGKKVNGVDFGCIALFWEYEEYGNGETE